MGLMEILRIARVWQEFPQQASRLGLIMDPIGGLVLAAPAQLRLAPSLAHAGCHLSYQRAPVLCRPSMMSATLFRRPHGRRRRSRGASRFLRPRLRRGKRLMLRARGFGYLLFAIGRG